MSTSTELAPVEAAPAPALSMIDGPDPAAALDYARRLSASLVTVLEDGGYATIQGNKHVTAEGWQTLAAATGHTCEIEYSRVCPDVEPMRTDNGGLLHAWEARAIVRDQNGTVVAAGESMADPYEGAKWARNEFSIRSMSQTRAMGRALSARMRYVVRMGGFSGTPAEEMPGGSGGAAGERPRDIAKRRYRALRDTPGIDEGSLKALGGADPDVLVDDVRLIDLTVRLARGETAAPAGDDQTPVEGEITDEGDDDPIITSDQNKALWELAEKAGLSTVELRSVVEEVTGRKSTKEIRASQRALVVGAIETLAAAKAKATGTGNTDPDNADPAPEVPDGQETLDA